MIKKPTIFPAPAFAIQMALGEMGHALLLSGAKIMPKRLVDAGYTFKHPNLEEALEGIIRED